jgi:PhnB protein
MKIQPYLFFKGNCEEAFTFYEKALGGKIADLHRFKDMPPQEGAAGDGCGDMSPEALKAMGEKIMHISLAVGDQMLMGSDNPEDAGQGFHGITLSIGIDDVNEGRKVFEAMSQGGVVKMPYGETFWAGGFGMLTDRFGVAWMVNAGDKPSP